MQQELEPRQLLETRKNELSSFIRQRDKFVMGLGSKIFAGSSPENKSATMLNVGRVRARIGRVISERFPIQLKRTIQELEVYDQAIERVRQEKKQFERLDITDASESVSLSKVDVFIQELPEEARSLLTQVRDSEDFRYVAEVVSKFVPKDNQPVKGLRRCVAGYLFETLAYSYLQKQLTNENKVFLSPKETLEVYYQLHPTRRRIDYKYGLQRGIEGISVPDGIVLAPVLSLSKGIKEVRIDGICEYMLGTRAKLKRAQLTRSPEAYMGNMRYLTNPTNPESMGVANYIRSKYPHLPDNVSVNNNLGVFVVLPSGVKTPFETPGVEQIVVPVSRRTFGKFIDAFMSDAQEKC